MIIIIIIIVIIIIIIITNNFRVKRNTFGTLIQRPAASSTQDKLSTADWVQSFWLTHVYLY